jgi:CRP-like cAMP-binding protein
LSGKVEIFSIKDNERTRVNVLSAGESFGRIQLINDIRMASVATLEPTEFLVIDKREYMNVLCF